MTKKSRRSERKILNIGDALPHIFTQARPFLDTGDPVIIAGFMLALSQVEALPLYEPRCGRVIFGYSLLLKLVNAKPQHYYSLLREPCMTVSFPLIRVSADKPLLRLLLMFYRRGFGFACVHKGDVEGLATLTDVLQLYRKGVISTELKVRDVASTIFRLPQKTTLGTTLRLMFHRRVRRVFIRNKSYVSEREIIRFLFSSQSLLEMRDSPHKLMEHTIAEIPALQATEVSAQFSIPEASCMIDPKTPGCLVCRNGVVTPWDLVMKPWRRGSMRARLKVRALSRKS